MSYQQYGISQDLVERVKLKMKNKAVKQQMGQLVEGVTKADLQNRRKVEQLIKQGAKVMGIVLPAGQLERISAFVLAQRIDPNNTFHLIKLWGMFR